jgi:hypothetical protein
MWWIAVALCDDPETGQALSWEILSNIPTGRSNAAALDVPRDRELPGGVFSTHSAVDDALVVETWPRFYRLNPNVGALPSSPVFAVWDPSTHDRPGVRTVAESLTNAGRPRPGSTWVAGAPLAEASVYIDGVFVGLAGERRAGPRLNPLR